MENETQEKSILKNTLLLINTGINSDDVADLDSGKPIESEEVLNHKLSQLKEAKIQRKVMIKRFAEFMEENGAKTHREQFETVFKSEIENFNEKFLQLKILIEILEYECKNKTYTVIEMD